MKVYFLTRKKENKLYRYYQNLLQVFFLEEEVNNLIDLDILLSKIDQLSTVLDVYNQQEACFHINFGKTIFEHSKNNFSILPDTLSTTNWS